jgi:hypothetical protein
MPIPKSDGAECKQEAIRNVICAKDLESMRVSGFRDFPFDGENAGELVVRINASTASAYLGFKSIFVDSQALDFCLEGRIGDAELRCCASWS